MASNVKRRKRTKAKKRYIKKNKEMIGQDLVQDTVGTNQLLQYNQLIAILTPDVQYDTHRYNRYIDNLEDQQRNQQYGRNQQYNRDPNEQYQLKKASKKLYRELKASLFKNEPLVPTVNSWDAVAGGTATPMASPSSFIRSPEQQSSSSVEIQATPVRDPDRYVYDELRKKMDKRMYSKAVPSKASLGKWKTSIAKELDTGGPMFYKRSDKIARQVYRDLYPDQTVIPEVEPETPKSKNQRNKN